MTKPELAHGFIKMYGNMFDEIKSLSNIIDIQKEQITAKAKATQDPEILDIYINELEFILKLMDERLKLVTILDDGDLPKELIRCLYEEGESS